MNVSVIRLSKQLVFKSFLKKNKRKLFLREPIVLKPGPKKWVVLLKYGVVACSEMAKKEQEAFIATLKGSLKDSFQDSYQEDTTIAISRSTEGVTKEGIALNKLTPEKVAIVSYVLGRSLALDHFESESEKVLFDFGAIMKSLQNDGKGKISAKKLLKKVGFAMNIKNLAVGQMSLLEKPELTWDNSSLDKLYVNLSEEYELEDRFVILKEKLEMIFQNVEFILNYLEGKRGHLLEIIIILLIVIEIIIFVVELTLLS